jgi:hypothetical protein
LPGGGIFNLKKIFIPINEENQHWACIMMKEKQIQYYDSLSIGAGKKYMDSILQYLVDEDKGQGCVKCEESSEVETKVILMGHPGLSCHVPVVRSIFILLIPKHGLEIFVRFTLLRMYYHIINFLVVTL